MSVKNANSPFTKFNWANHQITDLEERIDKFYWGYPYRFHSDTDSKSDEVTYYFDGMDNLPPEILCLCGDIIHNFRASLDHLIYYLVKGPTDKTGFPICKTADSVAASLECREKEGLRHEVVKIIKEAKPYRGGTDGFWLLHQLDIRDKHKVLIAVGTAYSGRFFTPAEALRNIGRRPIDIGNIHSFAIDARLIKLLKAGDKLATVPKAEANQNMKFAFDIAFAEPGIADCHPVLETFQKISNLIGGTIGKCWPYLR